MPSNIVYVQCGTEQSLGWSALRLSLTSVRALEPSTPRILVTDEATARTKQFKHLESHFDACLVQSVFGNPKRCSRYLKTSLGRYVNSDYVFLDSDTILLSQITSHFSQIESLGMALDVFVGGNPVQRPGGQYDVISQHLNRKQQYSPYFNSGVIYVRKIDLTDRFFDIWHSLWREGEEVGVVHDQPTLGHALDKSGCRPAVLGTQYNAMVSHKESLRRHAHILHFFLSSMPHAQSIYGRLLSVQAANGYELLSYEQIAEILSLKCPMVRYGWTKFHLEAGDYFGAVRAYCRNRSRRGTVSKDAAIHHRSEMSGASN